MRDLILIGKNPAVESTGFIELRFADGITAGDKMTLAVLADIPTGKFLGRTSAESGAIELLNISDIGSIGIPDNSLSFSKLDQIGPGVVLGNLGIEEANVQELTVTDVVDAIPEDTVRLNRLKYIPTGKVLGRISPEDGPIEVIDPIGGPGGAGVTIVSVAHFVGIENRDGVLEREKIDVGLPYVSEDLYGWDFEISITWDAGDPEEPDPPFITIENYSSDPLYPTRLEIEKRDHLGRAFYTPNELQEFLEV